MTELVPLCKIESISTISTISCGDCGNAHILATKASASSTCVLSTDLSFYISDVGCMLEF